MSKESFADIYTQWIASHNEDAAIGKRARESDKQIRKPTISEIRRMKVQDELDLHNTTLDEALKLTLDFLNSSNARGLNKIRVITGKGLHSENGQAVLRPAVIGTLSANKFVRELCTNPKPEDGGSGAVIVILK